MGAINGILMGVYAVVAATLVFFDHSGDIIHRNISTSVGDKFYILATFCESFRAIC